MAHILVVDDDFTILNLIKDVLTPQGHAVELSSSGADALRKIHKTRFDLLILDRNMPSMDGLEVLRTLKADPAVAGLKVIMCTAADMLADVDEAFQSGAIDYVVKPLDMAKMNAKVARHTKRS